MRDAERVQIGYKLFRIDKAEVNVELNAIGRAGEEHGSGYPHSQLLPQGPETFFPLRLVAASPARLASIG